MSKVTIDSGPNTSGPNTSALEMSAPGNAADRAIKRRRVLDIMDAAETDSLLLTNNTSLCWYLDGSRMHISLAGAPIAALLVTRDGDHLVTFNNESERLATEEVPREVTIHSAPWHGSLEAVARELAGGSPMGESKVAAQLRGARQAFLPAESARYARLNAETATAMTDVLSRATPATTEFEIAAQLASRIVAMGAEPLVLLCNGVSRSRFRHPLPTHSRLGRRAMAVVCARRYGLVANVTRWVRFDGGTPAELDAESRLMAVEADIFDATVPGARLDSIFREIKRAYARHGFGPDQWMLHHQGGVAGYAGRDPRATALTDDQVVLNQTFTWNPSGPGVKIEDTVQLTEAGIAVLSVDQRWPATSVNGLRRPLALQL